MRRSATTLVLAATTGLATAWAACAEAGAVVWARTGTAASAMQADFDACFTASRTVRFKYDAPAYAAPGTVFIPENIGHERGDYFNTCMLEHGYHAVPLTPAEAAERAKNSSPDAMLGWLEQFYARLGFQQRITAASAPPLPEAADEPLTYGAVRFDPAGLTPAAGVVKTGGVILSGKITHRRTGSLVAGTTVRPDGFHIGIPTGSVLQQAVFRDEDGGDKTYWCGAYKNTVGFTDDMCARNGPGGYVLFHPSAGAHWIATGIDTHGVHAFADRDSFHLVESPTDLLGDIGFALAVRKLNKSSVVLEAVVNQGADYETLWKKALALDDRGRAILPFWTHRLVITATNGGVSATFSADGDGQGWPYQRIED